MKIIYSNKAEKQFLKLSQKNQLKVLKRTAALKINPLLGKKLKGQFKDLFSFKAWPYRIIYQLDNKRKTMFIITIEHRQGAYR